MTYQGRKDKFECDTCNCVEYVDGGLPKGWCYLKADKRIEHACEKCKQSIPKDRQFAAGQK